MNCLNLNDPEIQRIVKDFGEVTTSRLIEENFPNMDNFSYEAFFRNRTVRSALGIQPKNITRTFPAKRSYPPRVSQAQLMRLRRDISEMNNRNRALGINEIYKDYGVTKIGEADLYTWGIRKITGKLDVEAKLQRQVSRYNNTPAQRRKEAALRRMQEAEERSNIEERTETEEKTSDEREDTTNESGLQEGDQYTLFSPPLNLIDKLTDRFLRFESDDTVQSEVSTQDSSRVQGITRSQDISIDLPADPQQKLLDDKDLGYFRNTLDSLSNKFGIPYEIISDPNNPHKGYIDTESYETPRVIINVDKAAHDTPFYEYGQIFLNMIRSGNKRLYSNIVNEILETEHGKETLENFKNLYPEYTLERQVEESLSFLLGKFAKEEVDPKTGLHKAIKRLWDSILEFLSNAFNVEIKDIYYRTSIEELAKILSHPNINLNQKTPGDSAFKVSSDQARRNLERLRRMRDTFESLEDPNLITIHVIDTYSGSVSHRDLYFYANQEEYNNFEREVESFIEDSYRYIDNEAFDDVKNFLQNNSLRESVGDLDFSEYPNLNRILKFIFTGNPRVALYELENHIKTDDREGFKKAFDRYRNDSIGSIIEQIFSGYTIKTIVEAVDITIPKHLVVPHYLMDDNVEDFRSELDSRIEIASHAADNPTLDRRYLSRSAEFETSEGTYRVSGSLQDSNININFSSRAHGMGDVNKGLFFEVLPKVIDTISHLFSDSEYDSISFTAVTGETRKTADMRLKGYNIFAKRLFGRFHLVAEDQYTSIIPIPTIFKNRAQIKPAFKTIEDLKKLEKAKENKTSDTGGNDILYSPQIRESEQTQLKNKDQFEINYQIPENRGIEEFIASEKTIRDLAARMSDRIGIPVRYISDRSQKFKGKLENGTAVINLAYATLDTPIHEILGHPIIRAIKNRDKILSYNEWVEINTAPEMQGLDIDISREAYDKYVNWRNNTSKLYQNLLKEFEYGKGKEVLDRIKRDYDIKTSKYQKLEDENDINHIETVDTFKIGNDEYKYEYKEFEEYSGYYLSFTKNGKEIEFEEFKKEYNRNIDSLSVKYTLEEQQEEAIVELLGLYTADRLNKAKDGKLISLLKRLLKEMKAFMKQLLGQKEVEIDKLPDNMTLGDIADLLAYSNSKLILPGNEVVYTTPDNQQFKTYQEASNHISELAKRVEDVDLSNVDLKDKNKVTSINEINVDNFAGVFENFIKVNGKWYNQFTLDPNHDYSKDTPVSDKEIIAQWNARFDDVNEYGVTKGGIEGFIEENKEYEQTREIIEEWKKVNNIQYNPEEVYSRGQEFIHIHNAYANGNVETHLWLQNILQIIEDNETVGTSTELSFVTSPKGEIMKGMNTGIKKEAAIYIKAYPQPKDIAFASYIDNYTSSFSRTGDLLKGFSDKKREITGLTFTKSVPIRNLHTVIPNLADAIDNVAHHNEIVIGLTNTNFRLHYGPETDYQSKKLIDRINSILDQKYGKLVEPEIKKQGEKVVQYGLFSKGANDILDWFDTKEEAQAKADESNKQLKDLGEPADYSVKPITKPIGVQPTQTNETLKESIEDIKNKLGITKSNADRKRFLKDEINNLKNAVIKKSNKDKNPYKEYDRVVIEEENFAYEKNGGYFVQDMSDPFGEPETISKELFEQKIKEFGDSKKVKIVDDYYLEVPNNILYVSDRFDTEQEAKIYIRKTLKEYTQELEKLNQEKEYTEQALINTKIAVLKEAAKKYPRSLIRSEVRKISILERETGMRYEDTLFEDGELPFQKVSDSPDQLFSGRRAPIDINNIDTTEEALLVIENIMKNQELVLGRTKDDRYYIINNRKYARVSDTLPNDFDGDTSLYENSRVAGNTVDTIVRDFFSGNLKSSYIGISNEAKESLLKRLESIKEKIDSRGEVFLTNNIVLFNDELGVAGEVDILSVDKDGNFHLYDVKTTKKGSLKWYDTSYKGKMTKRNRHSLQLSAYNNLFEYQYGKKFKRMGIIPFELVYDEAGHIHGLNEADFIPHTYNTAVEQYIPKKNQQKTEEENFQERAYRKQQQEEQEYDPNEPLGDNYFELVNWKNKELEKIEKEKKRLKTILKYRDTSENRAILKNLEAKQKTIENQLQQLSHKEIDYMFHAILEDLYDLELALKSGSMHDIQNVKEKIDYYREFIKTLPNHPDFKPISEKVVRLEALQSKRNREKLMEELENSDLIKDVLDNVNKDITDPNDKYTIEDLLVANADIPWTDREFLGLISSNTGDTVLPQYLFAKFRTSLMRNTNTATDFVDKLQAYLQKHGAGEREWIYERDSMGGKTGRLIDVFSENWLEELSERDRLLRNYKTSLYETGENISQNYDEIIDWYTSKAVVVDFTRLSAVKEIYGTNPEYAKYFEKSTDEKIARYENNLKKQLGPRFNDVVDQILNKLSKFEELKQDDSIDPIWRNRTIASYNVWEFLDNYKKGLTGPINYKWEKGTSSVYFSPEAFSDLTILPINKISKVYYNSEGLREVEETDSGFYNEEYQKILNDPVKLEYWSIMKDMSEYVRDTYGLRDQGLTYAKIQDAYAERLLQDLDFLKKNPKLKNLKKLFLDGAREYKSFFYEQGTYSTEKGIRSNYSDTSRVEISKLSKTYILQGMKPKEAYKKARREVLENYTPNLNNAMKAAVLEAAVQNARLETESLSQGLLDVFKSIKARDEKGEATVERVNAISRLEAYIDKVILNRSTKYRDSKDLFGRTISDQGWLEKILTELGGDSKVIKQIKEADLTKYLSEADKKILENLRGLKGGNYSGEFKIETTLDGETVTLKRNYDKSQGYFYTLNSKEITKDEFDELFDEYIDKEISNIGLDLNMAGLLDGVLKSVILSGLGLNPISGIFNRIEGKHSAMIMDLTGEYWTTGNIDHANQFLAFSNLIRLSPFKVPRKYKDKQVQIQIFQEVLDRFQVLQDRKRENERVMRSNRMDRNLLNIFQFAVDNPEFKNQGAIMLSVMMDTKIFDNNGNEYKFFDPETMTFPALNLNEGAISIKPEFSDSFSFNTPEMERMVLKIEDAVSHSQGNYNQHDIMKIKRGVWGRALTTFMTWFPEQVNQRWGTRTTGDELNINLFTGKERRDGRYVEAWKTSKPAFLTFVLTSLGISYGMLGMAGIIGTGIIGAIVYQKFLKKVTANTQREVNYIKEMVEFLKSLLIETLNYPSRALNTSDKFRIKNRSFENTTMSEQDIAALRAITRELAIMLSLLSVKLAYGMLRYDDDDDKESSKRMRYNFVQNQLSRGINALSTYTNPHSLVTDHSRIALLSHLENIWKLLDGVIFDPDIEKAKEGLLGFSPLPNILTKGTLPWENKMVYDEMTGFTGITPPMKWTQEFIKDFDTGGEYSAKKDYNEARKDIRDKYKKDVIKKYGSNKNVVKAVVDAKMRLEIGSKPSELTYKEAYAKITKGEKLEPVRRIRRPKPKNVLIQELAERLEKLGVPRAEAKKIAMEELK